MIEQLKLEKGNQYFQFIINYDIDYKKKLNEHAKAVLAIRNPMYNKKRRYENLRAQVIRLKPRTGLCKRQGRRRRRTGSEGRNNAKSPDSEISFVSADGAEINGLKKEMTTLRDEIKKERIKIDKINKQHKIYAEE